MSDEISAANFTVMAEGAILITWFNGYSIFENDFAVEMRIAAELIASQESSRRSILEVEKEN